MPQTYETSSAPVLRTWLGRLAAAAGLVAAASLALAQPAPAPAAAPPPGPAPTGLVVGSGNPFSPIVADLDAAVAFYRAIGFEVRGEPGNADANPQLRAMFGLPDARLRWQIGRVPPVQGGVEIIEIADAGGQRVERSIQEPGSVMLIVVVRDVDATLARLKALGAPVITRGGEPVPVSPFRAVVVQDPAGHFVELLQPQMFPAWAPATANAINVRVRHTVADLPSALRLYRDALGLQGDPGVPGYVAAPDVLDLLGLGRNTQYRYTTLTVPTSGVAIELIEFKGARRPELARLQDPGSTRMQLRVADIDAAAAALVQAGGTFVSTGGRPLDLPAGSSTLKVGIVRDPDNLFLVLIQAPPPAPQ